MDPVGAAFVSEARLRLSKAPAAEVATAALEAQHNAGIDPTTGHGADFIVVAVPHGTAPATLPAVLEAVRAAPDVPLEDLRVR